MTEPMATSSTTLVDVTGGEVGEVSGRTVYTVLGGIKGLPVAVVDQLVDRYGEGLDRPGRAGTKLVDLAVVAGLAVAVMPALPGGSERYDPRPLTELWLRTRESVATAKAYRQALHSWASYCAAHGIDPLGARVADTMDWVSRSGWTRGSTVNAKLSVLSAWYAFLIKNEAATRNPAGATDRGRVDRRAGRAPTVDPTDVGKLLRYLECRAASGEEVAQRDYALVLLLLATAMRSGACAHALRSNYGVERGHRVLTFWSKGKTHEVPVPPNAAAAVDAYLATRDARVGREADLGACWECGEPLAEHLFLTSPHGVHAGNLALTADQLGDLIRRLARAAGVANWRGLRPHSTRHAAITALLAAGWTLRQVQEFVGHADPRTTAEYDHLRLRLDDSPAYALGRTWSAAMHGDDEDQDDAGAA